MRGDTVHFDIVDQAGNMISATPSGGWLHSSPVIPELGFCLGTRAQMFWLEEGHPAALAPGKRPRTTLSPTLALRDGEPYLAWGSPGGDGQDQWITQLFMRHVHAGMNLQESIDAPAWHSEHFPSSFWPRTARPGVLVVEGRVPKKTVAELERRGHIVEVGPDWSEGRLTAASRDGRRRRAAANARGMQGYAAGGELVVRAEETKIAAGCAGVRNDGYAATVPRNSSTSLRSFSVASSTSSDAASMVCAELRVCVTPPATSPKRRDDSLGAGRGAGDVVRNFSGRRFLLLDRDGDLGGVVVDVLHALRDVADRGHRFAA